MRSDHAVEVDFLWLLWRWSPQQILLLKQLFSLPVIYISWYEMQCKSTWQITEIQDWDKMKCYFLIYIFHQILSGMNNVRKLPVQGINMLNKLIIFKFNHAFRIYNWIKIFALANKAKQFVPKIFTFQNDYPDLRITFRNL